MTFKHFLKESSNVDPYKFLEWKEYMVDDLKQWLEPFQLDTGKAPRGFKDKWNDLKFINRNINTVFGVMHDNIKNSFSRWSKDDIDEIVTKLGSKNKKTIEVKGKYATFKNFSNMADKTFIKRANDLDKHLSTLKGVHKKALNVKPLEVHFVKKEVSKATAVYKSEEDKIFIRSDRKAIDGDGYGSFNYIITHELGHRFERLIKYYDRLEHDYTTRYSRADSFQSEAFAELFALSHYGIKKYPDYENQIKRFNDIVK